MVTTAHNRLASALPQRGPLQRRWRVADGVVFCAWIVLVSIIVRHHEPWADEAQSWLQARDLDLKTLWFHELRYEGTPGLWHTILWIAQHWFHAPYAALGVIGMSCTAAGVAFILWKAPFLRPLSYLLVFSYFLVYQYAVVARSYNLLPLPLFMAACFYRDRNRPVRMTASLILLASVAVHGILLAASLGFCYLLKAAKERPQLSKSVRRQYLYCAVVALLACIFLFVILKPTADVTEFAHSRNSIPHLAEFARGALLVMGHAFLDQWALSLIFVLLAAAWCYTRGELLSFVLPVALMSALFVAVHGRPHHVGTVFLAAIAGLWIAWPTEDETRRSSGNSVLARRGIALLLTWVCCLNIWDAGITMRKDYLRPYSGALDTANYLKQVDAEGAGVFGYGYGMSAVQAYFDRNILLNIPTTYYHQGLPLYGTTINWSELAATMPEYVIVFVDGVTALKADEYRLNIAGYRLVHLSLGAVFFKRFNVLDQNYYIYRRVESSSRPTGEPRFQTTLRGAAAPADFSLRKLQQDEGMERP
jgi:hypothetical protein